MKLVDEFRDPALARRCAESIARAVTRPWRIMEVCGGQTHSIVRFGIDQLLPDAVTLIHGPGCPVCVTPLEMIDRAIAVAERPGVTLCSFGDMLRVPGSRSDLFGAKSRGADVRVVYSPLDALAVARENPERQVVFFAVGFETTAPAIAMCAHLALREGAKNFSLLVSHVLVPPALLAILSDPEARVDAFLAAGHVCTVMGLDEYRPIAAQYRVPIVATGFEPLDLLQGILMCIEQLESGRHEVENQYARSVAQHGNAEARRMVESVFEVVPRKWRGIGEIPESGLGLRAEYHSLDAERRFELGDTHAEEPTECHSGRILRGVEKPADCPAFGTRCTPEHPLGATMVSSEGACAAYFAYRRPGA
ncbi:MAG: hydrogenase formation protein HypD [Myxococcales bacterium]|nr:hydrogenase formation protein HypD [Myxococcales bacterium]